MGNKRDTTLGKLNASGFVAYSDAEVDALAELMANKRQWPSGSLFPGRLLVTLLEKRPGRPLPSPEEWIHHRCGYCHAEPGEHCKTLRGAIAGMVHVPRRMAAVRARALAQKEGAWP